MDTLTHLLASPHRASTPVAFGSRRDFSWNDFESRVAGLCAQIEKSLGGRWLLGCRSSYSFAVGLFALWHTGRVAVLPSNAQEESLREAAVGVRGVITDSPWRLKGLRSLSPLGATANPRRWSALPATRVCLELFTSGSTGKRKAIGKTFAQLQAEISVLEKTFGSSLGKGRVHATVSHQHIYGLLFRLLWPLCAGRPFADETILLWEEMRSRLPKGKIAGVVSSPAHLERLSSAGETFLRATRPRVIFSSGGPLRQEAAAAVRRVSGKAPLEVFGSTETGGVAWRRQARGGSAEWTPLSGVRVIPEKNKEGRLRVRSPFVNPRGSFLMSDRGRLTRGGHFWLEGRIDRVVKIAEKRVSLNDMERRLARHRFVAEARVTMWAAGEPLTRLMPGAVVILGTRGMRALKKNGRAALTSLLRAHLQKSFDASTVPRVFRFIRAWPRDAQGKIAQSALVALLQTPFDPLATEPQRLRASRTNASLRLRLKVPHDLGYLQGHFPSHPVVPGVVQLKWVIEAASTWLKSPLRVRRMEAVKFKNLLLPGAEFSLVVDRGASAEKNVVRFSLADGETLYSSGRLVLE